MVSTLPSCTTVAALFAIAVAALSTEEPGREPRKPFDVVAFVMIGVPVAIVTILLTSICVCCCRRRSCRRDDRIPYDVY
ncbi:Uncharacterized protein PBTT_00771 [Plasmodiophora brassicae]|uniref:Uncharacterized protein n=1 Tax=Plasmodiophora brassicae TaxID=37360 RepID=A0A0G4IHV3_PLABS|nr:hypothetical protein PBRA_000440 [Plasmodiophora brassicae]SPQ93081.1 unnamed protein product [Plasmodiophora brassicae]